MSAWGRLAALLNEPVMGFLALAAMSVGLAPFLFELSPGIEQVCEAAGWAIIVLFGLEYAANLAIAPDLRKFMLDRWRMFDLAILVAAGASLLPAVSDAARLGPALRILRLFRALLFGTRAGFALGHPVLPPPRPLPTGEPRVGMLRPGDAVPRPAQWDDLLRWAAAPTHDWLHASNLSPERLVEIAAAAGAPRVTIEAALHEASYPRLETGPRWTALTLSMPGRGEEGRRDPVLLLFTEADALSLALHPLELQQPPSGFEALPWGTRCALDVVRRVLARNEELAGRLERAARQLEELPPDVSPRTFFEQTFRLKRQLAMAKGDLWRLRGMLEMLAEGRRTLPGLAAGQRELLRELAEEADYLHETVDDIREAVLSIIELHIDVAGHDMNRFMRLLAIVSVLGLIPAVAGGLFGMNLADSPWTVTLGEVAFMTLVLMIGVLYAFMAKGWLR
jgi:Mg2+ and Co2+ transporter CorA